MDSSNLNSKSTVDGQFKFMGANAMSTTVGLSTAVGQFVGRQQLGCLLQLGSTLGDNSWVVYCSWAVRWATTVGLSTVVGQYVGRQQLGCLLQLGSTLGDNSWVVLKCNWAHNLSLK
jgi:hypothetical protein